MKIKTLQLTFFLLLVQYPLFSQWDFLGIGTLPNGHSVLSMEVAPDGSLWIASTLDNFDLPDNVLPVSLRSNDEGQTWTKTPLLQGAGNLAQSIAPVDEMTAYISLSYGGLAKTIDGGQTYSNVNSYDFDYNFITHFFNEEEGVVFGRNAMDTLITISITQDSGETWTHIGGNDWSTIEGFSLFEINNEEYISNAFSISSLYDVRGNTMVIGTNQGNYLISTDKGHNWERRTTPLAKLGYWATSITVTEDNNVMVGGNYDGTNINPTTTFTTKDNGMTWIEGAPNIENAAIHYIPETDSIFIISGHNNFGGGFFGTAISYNYGADWENIGEERILSLAFSDQNTGYGVCCQNGWASALGQVYKWNFDLPTSTFDFITNDYLEIFPNPARDILQVKINSQSNFEEAILEIISSTGEVVWQEKKSFVSDIQQDISDLPKGIYLLRIRTNNKSLSKKFVKI